MGRQRIHPCRDHPRVDLIEARVTRITITTENGKKVKKLEVRLWWKGQVYDPVRGIVIKTLRRRITISNVPLTNTNNAQLVVSPSLPIKKAWIGLKWPGDEDVYWGT